MSNIIVFGESYIGLGLYQSDTIMYFLAVLYVLSSLSSSNCYLREHFNDWPNTLPPFFHRMKGSKVLSRSLPLYLPSLQSPINIRTDLAASVPLPPLQFNNLLYPGVLINMKNVGYTVKFSIANESVKVPSITGGPLASHGEFEFSNLHVHWGTKDTVGGEHMIDGHRNAMEGHCVHFNKKYGSLKEAKKHADGLAVVAFFGKIQKEDNPKLDPIIDLLQMVTEADSSVELIPNEVIMWFAKLAQPYGYFTYPGSLTSPPYSENVFWIVYNKALNFSSRQVEAFRSLQTDLDSKINENARQIQQLNGRPIIYAVGSEDNNNT